MEMKQQMTNRIVGFAAAVQVAPSPSPSPGGIEHMPDGLLSRLLLAMGHPWDLVHKIQAFALDWMHRIMPIAIGILVVVAGLFVAVRIFFMIRDRRISSEGRRIRILPPPTIPDNGGEVLWTVLHGVIPPRWKRLLRGQPGFSWEVQTTSDGLVISIWVSTAVPVSLVEHAINSAWPGASLQVLPEEPLLPSDQIVRSAQLGLARPEWLPVGSSLDDDPNRVVLASMAATNDHEACVMQILARPLHYGAGRRLIRKFNSSRNGRSRGPLGWLQTAPTIPRPAPIKDPTADLELKAAHTKAASPLWDCSVRVAASGPTRGNAKSRAHTLASAFAVHEGLNGLRRGRFLFGRKSIEGRMPGKSFCLSVKELAGFATLPSSAVPGMDLASARIVAPSRAQPLGGRVLGDSNSGVHGRAVALSVADARHHLHVVGETGAGKSTLLANLVLQDAVAKRTAVVIDPKGDLIEAILQRLPAGADSRTCLIDPTDPTNAVGLNVLSGSDSDLVVDHIASLFKRIYEHHWGPRSDDILRAACATLAKIPGATLAEVPLLLTNAEWRRAIRYRLNDPVLRNFWEQFDSKVEAQRSQDIAPLMNKLRAFLMRGAIRTILGQANPARDFEDLLDEGGLILVRIPKGLLGEDCSQLLGGLVIARIWQACMKRSALPEDERTDVALYVDEMHNYLTLPRSFEDLLAEARGYRLSLVLAHQHLGQLNRDVKDALGANARTKIVFACSPQDAKSFAEHFEPALSAYDLSRLEAFTAACRPCLNGANGSPFTFRTIPLEPGSADRAIEVRIASGESFGTPRSKVEKKIRDRQMNPEIMLLPKDERPGGRGRSGGHSVGESDGQFPRRSSSTAPEEPDFPGEAA